MIRSDGDADTDTGTALVTGGSRGIGYELARLLAADGYDLVLVARDRERLREAGEALAAEHGVAVTAVVKDLADPAATDRIETVLDERGIEVDVLVNNAGFGTYGPFVGSDREAELDQIRVNVAAVTELTHRLLPRMVERGAGRVLNVASTAAFQPGPLMATYYATKAYVLSFSEALAEETRGTGVTVTALCPGPTETAFHERADMEASRLLSFGVADAASVAERGYRGMQRGETVVVPGLRNRLLARAVGLLPRSTVRSLVRWVQSER
jgi:hypothetical protein